jgi:hypothetical protein
LDTSLPDPDRPLEDGPYLSAAAVLRRADDLVVDLLEDARHGGHEGGLHRREAVEDLVDAPVDAAVQNPM